MAEEQKPDLSDKATSEAFKSVRFRWVLYVVVVLGVVGFLVAGFGDAGSYAGYTAGSLFRPDLWASSSSTTRYYYDDYYTDRYGLTDKDVNERLDALRYARIPGLVLSIVVAVAGAGGIVLNGMGAVAVAEVWKEFFSDERTHQYFLDRYAYDHPGKPVPGSNELALYACVYTLDPACAHGVPGTMLNEGNVSVVREMFTASEVPAVVKLGLNLYLWLDGLRLSGTPASLVPLFSGISAPHATVVLAEPVAVAQAGLVGPPQVAAQAGEATGSVPPPRFCPHCGSKLPPGARFCPVCGAGLSGR